MLRIVAVGTYNPRVVASPGAPSRLLPADDRHLVRRFSYGITPRMARDVRRAGGGRAWFEQQLADAGKRDRLAEQTFRWWPSLAPGPRRMWQLNTGGVAAGWEVMADYQRWVLARRIASPRQVNEVMTAFWESHLNVPTNGEQWFVYRRQYGDVIRRHALGRFDDLLHAAITHPAMLIYLDNAVSTAAHPNENLGRELLELHTVGRGHYTEDDVKDSARILTGWRVDVFESWSAQYDPASHWRGRVEVMGFKDANKAADGRELTQRYLTYLAHHPATAERIARKLATAFVRDDPPEALVRRLAKVYRRHDTEIVPVLRALVDSREFRRAAGAKVTNPLDDVVATYRALGARLAKPSTDASAANAILWQCAAVGATPFGWPRPDGLPVDDQPWTSPARLLASWQMHYTMSGGWWPSRQVRHRKPAAWLPAKEIRFDDLVDHLARELLHRRASKRLVRACSEAVGAKPAEKITADHAVVRWQMPRLLTTFLDSPDFFTR